MKKANPAAIKFSRNVKKPSAAADGF